MTRADFHVARQLNGLGSDFIPSDDGGWLRVPHHQRVPFDEAVRRALAAEEAGRGGLWERLVRRFGRPTSP